MSGKMMITYSDNYQVYARADGGEDIYLEIDDPEYFEAEPSRLMVKIPLGDWAYLAKDFIKKHERHFTNNEQQMELDLC